MHAIGFFKATTTILWSKLLYGKLKEDKSIF